MSKARDSNASFILDTSCLCRTIYELNSFSEIVLTVDTDVSQLWVLEATFDVIILPAQLDVP
jgi:hypothetical protein